MSVITSPRRGDAPAFPSPPAGGGPPPAVAPTPVEPPSQGPQRPPRRRGWGRIVLGALVVLLCAAGGTAVFVLEQVHSLSDALAANKSLNVSKGALATAGYGAPETLLLVGDDTRRGFKYYRGYVPDLANEMLLVRLDPSKPYISLMSIPRELMATIYDANGHVVYVDGLPQNRLNSALSVGGHNLAAGIGALLKTIELDLHLSVNHVLVATFQSFERAVNEMGCVYTTVDQRYYNKNLGTPGTNYQSINLQPGYQKLCGQQAEEFVSYRHTDTSVVRDARDQSFLIDVKKQYGPTLIDNIGKFERIFGQAVQTDPGLHSWTQLLSLIDALVHMSSQTIRQVHFQANLQPTNSNPCSCDTASPQQIQASINQFLHGASQVPSASSVSAQARAVHSKKRASQLPLVPTPPSALAQARAAAAKMGLVLEYPRVEDRSGSSQPPYLRVYSISAPGGTAYPAYVAVFYAGGLGNYYDVQGTSWTTAPQFDSPDRTITVGGRTYYLYYESSNLRMVAWYEHDAVYWVRNSLTDSVANGELMAIAEQTRPFTTTAGGAHPTPLILRAARVPFPTTANKPIPLRLTIGGIAALVTLVALPLLLFLGLRRFLDLRRPRALLVGGAQIGERLPVDGTLLASSAPSPVPLLAPQVALGEGVLPRTGSVRWVGSPRVYHRWSISRTALLVSIMSVLALAAAGAAAAVLINRHSPARVHHVKRAARPLIPTVPVVVLNATTVPGAAHKLAVSLRADRIDVTNIGNLTETLPPGNEILYAPGERQQAQRLAHLLRHQVATIAPMDPVVAGAAGGGAKLVVVIT